MDEAILLYIITLLSFQELIAAETDLKALLFMANQTTLRFTSMVALYINTWMILSTSIYLRDIEILSFQI